MMRWTVRAATLTGILAIGGIRETIPAIAGPDDEATSGRVTLLNTPGGGIQPQAAIGTDGVVHLIYFKGDPTAGDVFYTRLGPGKREFASAIRVNGQPGSAVAVGTIRGAQLAIGRGGRVHVAWNGSGKVPPKAASDSTPMLYARSDREGKAFETQRNSMTKTSGLDGGGTVAVGPDGDVYVAWHGRSEDSAQGEDGRRMWMARSRDDGATFAPEEPAFDQPTGACGCCGTRAMADGRGTLYVLYRAATKVVGRDMYPLTSRDRGTRFRGP